MSEYKVGDRVKLQGTVAEWDSIGYRGRSIELLRKSVWIVKAFDRANPTVVTLDSESYGTITLWTKMIGRKVAPRTRGKKEFKGTLKNGKVSLFVYRHSSSVPEEVPAPVATPREAQGAGGYGPGPEVRDGLAWGVREYFAGGGLAGGNGLFHGTLLADIILTPGPTDNE